jgi:hypothetical protein
MSAGPEPICGTGVGAVVPAGGVGTGACPSAALTGGVVPPVLGTGLMPGRGRDACGCVSRFQRFRRRVDGDNNVNCRGAPYLLDLNRDLQVERIIALEVLSGYVCECRSVQNDLAYSRRSNQRHPFQLDLRIEIPDITTPNSRTLGGRRASRSSPLRHRHRGLRI